MAKGVSNNPKMWLERAQDTTWAAELPDDLDVLVLSLGCTLNRGDTALATSSLSSLRAGIQEYKNWKALGKRVKLVCVGSGYYQVMPHYEWDLMMEEAVQVGVPAEDVFGEPHSFNTPMNAVCVGTAIAGKRIGLIVVTSDPLHNERAYETFKAIFGVMGVSAHMKAIPGEMPVYGNSSKWFLRNTFLWRLWNRLGRLILPRQTRKLERALKG